MCAKNHQSSPRPPEMRLPLSTADRALANSSVNLFKSFNLLKLETTSRVMHGNVETCCTARVPYLSLSGKGGECCLTVCVAHRSEIHIDMHFSGYANRHEQSSADWQTLPLSSNKICRDTPCYGRWAVAPFHHISPYLDFNFALPQPHITPFHEPHVKGPEPHTTPTSH